MLNRQNYSKKGRIIMVSIIIPSYQRPVSLKRAINSCMAQTYKDIEIIVVDDNNPDTEDRIETEKVMQEYNRNQNIIYLKHDKNRNGSAARNTGIRCAKGEYITFLDNDDILFPNKIEKQVRQLEELPKEYGVSFCAVEMRDEENNKLMKVIHPKESRDARFDILRLRFGSGSGSNPLFRREAVDRTGFFDERFKRNQDVEYMVRIAREFKPAALDEVLMTKFQGNHDNRPKVELYEQIQTMFFETFGGDIAEYSEAEQNEIYRNRWHQLCIVAVDARNWRKAKEYYRIAKKYMSYTMKMRLGILRHIINKKF